MKAEQFIKDYTNNCSNEMVFEDGSGSHLYEPWLTPEQALAAVEIARKELVEKACEFFGEHLWEYIDVKNANCDTFINIDGDKLTEDFKNYIKGE